MKMMRFTVTDVTEERQINKVVKALNENGDMAAWRDGTNHIIVSAAGDISATYAVAVIETTFRATHRFDIKYTNHFYQESSAGHLYGY